MSLTWTRSEIRSKFRELTKNPDTSQISDSDINDKINDFYRNKFPFDIKSILLKGTYPVSLSPTDSGRYSVDASILKIQPTENDPLKLNGQDVEFTQDRQKFFDAYPKDTGSAFVISDSGVVLAIGSDTTKVANSAFYYEIGGYSYYKAATETSLSGSTIPQSKYGAWRLEINADGTISIEAASANSTGYTTPAKAIEGIADESSTKAAMGYVTVINTSGTFIPGTTGLDAVGVTDTYTDGWNSTRNRPEMILLYDNYLYAGPKPDDWYELVIPYLKRPDELSSDSSVPLDVQWGMAIAYGTSIEHYVQESDDEKISLLAPVYSLLISDINKKYSSQQGITRRVKASF